MVRENHAPRDGPFPGPALEIIKEQRGAAQERPRFEPFDVQSAPGGQAAEDRTSVGLQVGKADGKVLKQVAQ